MNMKPWTKYLKAYARFDEASAHVMAWKAWVLESLQTSCPHCAELEDAIDSCDTIAEVHLYALFNEVFDAGVRHGQGGESELPHRRMARELDPSAYEALDAAIEWVRATTSEERYLRKREFLLALDRSERRGP